MSGSDMIDNGNKEDDENIELKANEEEYDEAEANHIIHFQEHTSAALKQDLSQKLKLTNYWKMKV